MVSSIDKLPKRTRERWDKYARRVFDSLYGQAFPTYNILIVSFSGGPDSTALLCACTHLRDNFTRFTKHLKDSGYFPADFKPHIIAAHLDHAIRATSDADAEWCAVLAKALDVEFVLKRLGKDELEKKRLVSNVGIETAAREFRREFQVELATEISESRFVSSNGSILSGFPVLLNGHTANDQAETVLMNLARGSGLRGACGIAKRAFVTHIDSDNGVSLELVRPFIETPKSELLDLLDTSKFEYLTDETNLDDEYTARNTIRSVVIPALEKFYPSAVEHLTEFAGLARSGRDYAIEQADSFLRENSIRFCDLFKELILLTGDRITEELLPKASIREVSSPIRYEIYSRLLKQNNIALTNSLFEDIDKLVFSDIWGEILGIVEASTEYFWINPHIAQIPPNIDESKEAFYQHIEGSFDEILKLKAFVSNFPVPVQPDSVHNQRIRTEPTGKRISLKTYYRNAGIPESVIVRIRVLSDAKGKVLWFPKCINRVD